MAEKWKLPVFGEVDRRWVIGAGIGTAGLVFYMRWRYNQKHQKQEKQPPQEIYVAGQTGIDPAGNTGVIDPSTGYVYNSPEDLSRLGELSLDNYSGSLLYTPNQITPDTQRQGSRFKTNADWVRACEADMAATHDKATVQTALDGVLGGQVVTTAQKDIFLEAVGLEGQPPEGYPKPIRTSDTASQFGGRTLPGPAPKSNPPSHKPSVKSLPQVKTLEG